MLTPYFTPNLKPNARCVRIKCISEVFLYDFDKKKTMLENNFIKDTLNCSATLSGNSY